MKVRIVTVSHPQPSWIKEGFNEYVRRMPSLSIELYEVKPELRSLNYSIQPILISERKKIKKALSKNTRCIVLDERGLNFTTQELAQKFELWRSDSRDIAFIIGGADGIDAELKNEADMLLRLSSMTLPHGLVRIVLIEQLYRAWTLSQGHPYHRE